MTRDRDAIRERALKARDSWWTVIFVDAITIRLLPGVLKIPGATPMRITIVGIFVGLASVVSFSLGWLVAGALLFQARYLVDCLDGKVARVRGLSSAWGAFADLAADVAIVASVYAGLAYWAHREGVPGAWIGLVLLAAFAVASWTHLYRRLALGEDERTSRPRTGEARAWAWSRFRPYPSSVEVETTLAVFFPLLAPLDWYPYLAGGAAAFYMLSGADSVRRVRRRLRPHEPDSGMP